MVPRASVIVPAVVVPSPQLIVALKSLAVLPVYLSVKVATVPLKAWPALALEVRPLALKARSTGAGGEAEVEINDLVWSAGERAEIEGIVGEECLGGAQGSEVLIEDRCAVLDDVEIERVKTVAEGLIIDQPGDEVTRQSGGIEGVGDRARVGA